MTELQVPAGAGGVLPRSLRTADVLNLVVQGFDGGVNLGIVLTQVSAGLIRSHVSEGIRRLLSLTQASEGRHVNARARGTRRTGGSWGSWRTLREEEEEEVVFGI